MKYLGIAFSVFLISCTDTKPPVDPAPPLVCEEGFELKDGECVEIIVIPPPPACEGANEELKDGDCVCKAGFERKAEACVPIVVEPPPPPPTTALPKFKASEIQSAAKQPLLRYFFESSGTSASNSGFTGSAYVVLAYQSFAGDTSTDKQLVDGIRYTMTGGREPIGSGGYIAQHEIRYAVALVIAKNTPRIWSQFTEAEKAKLDQIMTAQLVGNAYSCAVDNPEIKAGLAKIRNIMGHQMWWGTAPNFSNACPGGMLSAYVYFGDAKSTEILNTFKKDAFAKSAQASGLPRIFEAWRVDGPAGEVGPRPTAAEVEGAIKDWKWKRTGKPISDIEGNLKFMLDTAWNNNVVSGVNDGAGIKVGDQMRGRIMKGADGLPNKGKAGMAAELDSKDAGGVRSAMSYAVSGTRIVLDIPLMLIATKTYDIKSGALKGSFEKMQFGMTDLQYKNAQGYFSHSKGGGVGNNEDWDATYHEKWGMEHTLGAWFSVIDPYLSN